MTDHAGVVRETLLAARGERRVDERLLDKAFASLSVLVEERDDAQQALEYVRDEVLDSALIALTAAEADRDRYEVALRQAGGFIQFEGNVAAAVRTIDAALASGVSGGRETTEGEA